MEEGRMTNMKKKRHGEGEKDENEEGRTGRRRHGQR
jgi:hypothetical protein